MTEDKIIVCIYINNNVSNYWYSGWCFVDGKIVQLTMKLSLYIYRHFCKPKVKYDVTTQYEDISGSAISKNSLSSVEITI